MKNLENLVAEYADLSGKSWAQATIDVRVGVNAAARAFGIKQAAMIKKIEDMGTEKFCAMMDELAEMFSQPVE